MLRAAGIAALVAGTACRGDTPAPAGYELAMRGPAGAAWMTMIRVETDDHLRVFPGTPLEDQPFMRGKPELQFHLHGTAVLDGRGHEVVACRGAAIFVDGRETGHLNATGFAYGATTVALAADGTATLFRPNNNQSLRYTPAVDACTAALLFFMVPVPRAG